MQFATVIVPLITAAINGVMASPACAAAASQPFPRSLSNLTPEQEAEVYKQIRSTWSNRTLEMEADLFAQRSSRALSKRCDSCSGDVGFAACVTTCGGTIVNGPSEQCIAQCACAACKQCSDWIECPDCCE